MPGLFVTGTDTGIGKTKVTAGLARAFARRGIGVAALKPVASGATATPEGLTNADALALREAASVPLAYTELNPYVFVDPVAPQLAAARAGCRIDLAHLSRLHARIRRRANWVLIEGVGGWRVPLNETADVGDLAREYGYPVLLIVGLRLGCINHARLTAEAIARDGLAFDGWVANLIDPDYDGVDDTIAAITSALAQAPRVSIGFQASNADRQFTHAMDSLCAQLLTENEARVE